ncbi:MAG: hypothetical protein DHS20C18_30150 [Saprospiraceae bacterium]|nr:MAG: hypothetical protein DHS20C18_30150 [Saprospiraceae bacterium]
MKKTGYLLIFLFICFSLIVKGQTTFNKRCSFNTLATYLTSIIATDSCYYTTGIYADTVPFLQGGSLFVKLDLDGQPIFIKKLISPVQPYYTWTHTLTTLQDGNFAVTGLTYDPVMKGMLLKYNQYGDTIWTKEYLNPFYPEQEFIHPLAMAPMPDGGFVIACWIEKTIANGDIYLIKTNILGNKEWGKVYGNTMWDKPLSILITPENKIMIGAIRTNINTAAQHYTYQTHIFQVDSFGNMEWEYFSPTLGSLRDAANDMVLLEDGSLVVASGVGTEYERSSVNVVWFEKMLFKLNPAHELEWETTFMGDRPFVFTDLTNIIKLNDGSGFVAAGTTPAPDDNPDDEMYGSSGWVGKVSLEGDSIWTREYKILTADIYTHDIIDLKETPDGGFILCGEAKDWTYEDTIPQQAWLLKLDEFGCLVPGCGVTAVFEEGIDRFRLDIFPNPTTDYLNIYFRSSQHERQVSFRITDAKGRVIKTFQNQRSDLTFILPVWNWTPGIYFLQYLEDGKIRSVKRFIKQ